MRRERISNEDDFLNECPAAGEIRRCAEKEETEAVRWFFHDCWALWDENRFIASFKSYSTPEYAKHSLMIEAKKSAEGDWGVEVTSKTP